MVLAVLLVVNYRDGCSFYACMMMAVTVYDCKYFLDLADTCINVKRNLSFFCRYE
jgi:hypothetical protein